MLRKRKLLSFLAITFVSISCFALLLYLIFTFSPKANLNFNFITISVLPVAFLLFFIFIATLLSLFIGRRRAILVGIFALSFLLLRYFSYTNPLFILLLAAILIVIELSLHK